MCRHCLMNNVSLCCRFMAFDKHLNMVLGDSEELRKLPPKKGQAEVCIVQPYCPRFTTVNCLTE